MSRFSIIIPYYNRAKTLQRTLESVRKQTFRPLEILLVDNNSTDNGKKIAENFAKTADEALTVRMLDCEKNGAAAARNCGLQSASGNFVYFFDSDDEMSEEFLVDVDKRIGKSKVDAIFCTTQIIFPDNRKEIRNYGLSKNVGHQILSGVLTTQSVVYYREFLLRLGGWNEKLLFWDDWELGVRLLLAKPKTKNLSSKIYHKIYAHAESITGNGFSEHSEGIAAAFKEVKLDILRYPSSAVPRLMRILSHKEAIVAGQIGNEGDKQKAKAVFSMIKGQRHSLFQRCYCKLLYFYTLLGGRGAWHLG